MSVLSSPPKSLLTSEQVTSFEEDGFLVLKNLFDENTLQEVVSAGEAVMAENAPGTYFSTIAKGVMHSKYEAFRSVAIHSKLPRIAAELMQLDQTTQNARILRDVFLAKHISNNDTCGFHVDDQGFWPESYLSSASEDSGKDQSGINAWIALDDMPKEFEGSMAVAKRSHKASWRWEAYQAIGQDRTKHGISKEELIEMLKHGNKFGTCEGVENNRPDLKNELDKTSEIFDLKRGDVIFASRLLFHRTMPVTKEGQNFFKQTGKENLMRYSIRYVPGTARLPYCFSSEYSLMDNAENFGRTLNEVANDASNECWYPQVWPSIQETGKDSSKTIVIDPAKLDEMKAKQNQFIADFRSLIAASKT